MKKTSQAPMEVAKIEKRNEKEFLSLIHNGKLKINEKLVGTTKTSRTISSPSWTVFSPTPLIMAVIHHSLETVKELVKSGADITKTDNKGFTPMHVAVIVDRQDVVQFFLDWVQEVPQDEENPVPSPLDLVTCRTPVGTTPMFCAAALGNLPMMKFLVSVGGTVDCIRQEGDPTCLAAAARSLHLPVLQYLHDEHAEVFENHLRHRNLHGETPLLSTVASAKSPDISGVLTWLLDYGADIQAVDNRGRSALHIACEKSNVACIQTLIDKMCPVLMEDQQHLTALHVAAGSSSVNALQCVIHGIEQQGHDLETGLNFVASSHSHSALSFAAQKVRIKNIKLLLQHGANPFLGRWQNQRQAIWQHKVIQRWVFEQKSDKPPPAPRLCILGASNCNHMLLSCLHSPGIGHDTTAKQPQSSFQQAKILFQNVQLGDHTDEEDDSSMKALLYQGEPQYYLTQQLFFGHDNAVFVLTVDLSKPAEVREQMLRYWLSFLSSHMNAEQFTSSPHSTPKKKKN
eukprot:m.44996 g.44996  ORF g.44996 m.44996 type:complete len:514 (+) comp17342_c0_seq1:48-1589(+)